MVTFKKLTEQYKKGNLNYKLPIMLGENEKGRPEFADLTDLKHILMCGSTGSGKSMFEHTIISTFLSLFPHKELMFYMVDMKLVELPLYDGIPHLLSPVSRHDMDKIFAGFRWAIDEKDRRLKIGSAIKDAPYIIIIVDTFSDIMAYDPITFEFFLNELIGKNAAEVKMHVIMSDSRPSPDVYTSLILNLFPTKICFNVCEAKHSKLIIGTEGGEKLKGAGDILFLPPYLKKQERIQAPYISEEEIKTILPEKSPPPEYQ